MKSNLFKRSYKSGIETNKIGKNVRVRPFAVISREAVVGDEAHIYSHVVIEGHVQIGKNVSLFPGVFIMGSKPAGREGKTVIGAGTSVGAYSLIEKGVKIGRCCRIGEGVVVRKNISIADGVKILKGAEVTEDVKKETDIKPAVCFSKESPKGVFTHPLALLESKAVGGGTRVWAFAHVLPGAKIGRDVNICDHTFIENDVIVGDRVTIKSGVNIWDGLRIEDDVFIGPDVVFTNDPFPRSRQRMVFERNFKKTIIKKGASIGANATILPGVTIGEYSMIGAGAVITKNIVPFSVMVGNPARLLRKVKGLEGFSGRIA